MISFLISLFSLSIIIILHEAGHFLFARRFGVKVEEFGIGYPPRIFSFKKNEVIYSINAIPFGGFVKIVEHDGPNSFSSKSLGKRTIILLAGVVNNALIAFLLFTILFSIGMPTFALPEAYKQDIPSAVTIREIEKDSPASLAGLESGDVILGMERLDSFYETTSIGDVQDKTKEFQGKEIQLIIQREGESIEIGIIPRESPPEGKGYLGVILTDDGVLKYSLFEAPWQSIRFMGILTQETFTGLGRVFGNLFKHGNIEELTGPVGIMAITTRGFQWGWKYGLYILGLISYAFAIFNLFPIPAVDGGRILFLMIEKIRRKPISQRTEMLVNNICFYLLVILLFAVTIKDINFFILHR